MSRQPMRRGGYGGGVAAVDTVYVAECGRALVGAVRRTEEHGVLLLRGMQVEPGHQRKGIGTQLLRAFVDDPKVYLRRELMRRGFRGPWFRVPKHAQLHIFERAAGSQARR